MPSPSLPLINLMDALYKRQDVQEWLTPKKSDVPLLYNSFDLRDNGEKIAVVDANFFPAGFNNCDENSLQEATQLMQACFPSGSRLLLIPESHTRNIKYVDSISNLISIMHRAGFHTKVGNDVWALSKEIIDGRGKKIEVSSVRKVNGIIETKDGYIPDYIILNNDLTTGVPEILQNSEQPIIPSPRLGWWNRSKFEFFKIQQEIIERFAQEFNFDPQFISTRFQVVNNIDFAQQTSVELVIEAASQVLRNIKKDYERLKIQQEPFLVIKANQGTYGMGIMTIKELKELLNLNKKTRNKMSKVKGGAQVNAVLIQEGVTTKDSWQGCTAEPMLYYLNKSPFGYFYRYHPEKDSTSNLNAKGAHFVDISQQEIPAKWKLITKLSILALEEEARYLMNSDTPYKVIESL